MKMYITSGTFDYLRTIMKKNENQHLLLLQGGSSAVLLQESEGKSIFKEPRKYEIIDAFEELQPNGFIAMNNIPVIEEDRTLFEHNSKERLQKARHQEGFLSGRLLQPLGSEIYIILTQWQDESAFNAWQSNEKFFEESQHETPSALVNPQSLFTGKATLNKYYVTFDDEE
ncbi:antibiotic biosynthesis monooxygenase family protein [Bacillus sp. 1P06AnD]|uniref:antibiotic biosynthesis monooxygenase family protein n=1 Tax=Bacillus sp. 1P06AnD TaxID=3132208 RepID=UPI0039A31107